MGKLKVMLVAALVIVLTNSFLTLPKASASKPFLVYCAKLYPAGAGAQPDVLAIPNSNGSCQSGFRLFSASTSAQLISDMNLLSKTMFQNGWALGNYQTSVQLGGQPCIPGQPGCGH